MTHPERLDLLNKSNEIPSDVDVVTSVIPDEMPSTRGQIRQNTANIAQRGLCHPPSYFFKM